MRERPGRVLPSMIVGGLLIGGLVLGTGAASADTASTCTDGTNKYDISNSAQVQASGSGTCELTPSIVSTTLTAALSLLPKVSAVTSGTSTGTNSSGSTSVVPDPSPSPKPKPVPAPKHGPRSGSLITTQYGGQKSVQSGSSPAVLAPAALPAAAVPAAPRAALPGLPLAPGLPGLALTGGFAPTALAGGSLPGGLSSGLFGAGFGNPALLAGTPLGAAATSLYQPQADSAVTTVSHSEALAAGAPRGVGTPSAIAAIALACVVGLLVRSRVLRRISRRELVSGPGPVVTVSDPALSVVTGDHDPADAPLLAA